MHNRRLRNLGQTSLSAKRRRGQPMQAYDSLPAPLRRWLAQAALPWSPVSAKRIWHRAQQRGLDIEDTLRTLNRAESKTLSRDKLTLKNLSQSLSA